MVVMWCLCAHLDVCTEAQQRRALSLSFSFILINACDNHSKRSSQRATFLHFWLLNFSQPHFSHLFSLPFTFFHSYCLSRCLSSLYLGIQKHGTHCNQLTVKHKCEHKRTHLMWVSASEWKRTWIYSTLTVLLTRGKEVERKRDGTGDGKFAQHTHSHTVIPTLMLLLLSSSFLFILMFQQ